MELKWQKKRWLVEAALEVLNEPDPVLKAQLGEAAAVRWIEEEEEEEVEGEIGINHQLPLVPDRPSRLSTVKLVPSHLMPKLGKGGSPESRQAILHSLVHTESWAIDLSWDIIARFGLQESMPTDFFTDFVQVARDEGRHFTLLSARLRELGSFYGAFPAHDGLWDSATATSKHLLARLVIEHCVHEARGLDVLPTIISRFQNGGDEGTAKLLEMVVYPEEITHCAAGLKWFKYLCHRNPCRYKDCALASSAMSSQNCIAGEGLSKQQQVIYTDADYVERLENTEVSGGDMQDMMILTFHSIVRRYFRGPLKPPFNVEARKAAGFEPDWYEPLAVK
ncbi:uncharacterized protein M6B38_178990 [Iris pallida]|uniref:Ferritin-like superfamily n=1 Tax=Iris pallida TaxID=29817 RepID=A0AAX6EMH3_IRIPA|nr:uncharacterized protein M6B38_178990 [Iris pallida]